MPLNKFLIGFTILLVSICIGCQPNAPEENKPNYKEQLPGFWEVTQAIRDKKPTSTLEDAYFEFDNENSALVNVTGRDQNATYDLKKNIIKIKGTIMDGDYKILKLQNDSMILSADIDVRGIPYNFVFHMMKTTRPAEEKDELQ